LLKKLFTFDGKLTQRNLTAADIHKAKGIKKLSQTNPGIVEEAAAAVEAGIDMFICGGTQVEAIRAGTPYHFITAGVALHSYPTDEDTMRETFRTIQNGTDVIFSPRRLGLAKVLADEGIPVMGHLGLVPRFSTWLGGLRAFG
jgi:3-methyl-2-oxobutanoate hydroxymethyltransferase